jgi:hypothetical protein
VDQLIFADFFLLKTFLTDRPLKKVWADPLMVVRVRVKCLR